MTKKSWTFTSTHSWQEFAASFRAYLGGWQAPSAPNGIVDQEFQVGPSVRDGDPAGFDGDIGERFNVVFVATHRPSGHSAAIQLKLFEQVTSGTLGRIDYDRAFATSLGKDLPELIHASVRAVDARARILQG